MSKRGNTSSAVMQQRKEPLDSLDDFPTPPWATRAFVEHVLAQSAEELAELRTQTVWEPACNRGYMARPLAEFFGNVIATDVADYGWTGQQECCDFLTAPKRSCHWIITNPPFTLAEQFVRRCIEMRPFVGFAIIARLAFLEGGDRYRDLFAHHKPSYIVQYAERVPMVRGAYDPQASSATAYAWFVWLTGENDDPVVSWIPKCRDRLERSSDVTFERRDGRDWVAEHCRNTPLFRENRDG